jgi:hypothetical protein
MGLFSKKKKPLSVTLKTGFGGTASVVEIIIRAYQHPDSIESSWRRMSDEQSLRVLNSLAKDTRRSVIRGLRGDMQVGPAEFDSYSRDKERD